MDSDQRPTSLKTALLKAQEQNSDGERALATSTGDSTVPMVVQPVTINELAHVAEGLFEKYTEFEADKHRRSLDARAEQHKRELDHDYRIESLHSHGRLMLGIGVFLVIAGVLAIIAYLYGSGRDATATELFRYFAPLAVGVGGGYGIGKGTSATKKTVHEDVADG